MTAATSYAPRNRDEYDYEPEVTFAQEVSLVLAQLNVDSTVYRGHVAVQCRDLDALLATIELICLDVPEPLRRKMIDGRKVETLVTREYVIYWKGATV